MFFGGVAGRQFEDLSGVSGIDDPGDGRSFALLDYDRDGWLDIVLASASAPRLRLLRNGIGDRTVNPDGFVALRFVGGNTQAEPTREWSARDGFGTAVEIAVAAGTRIFREHQPEGGYLGQHSSTMVVGLGSSDRIDSLRVRWLSGKTQVIGDVPAGSLVTVYENPANSPSGRPFVVEPYRKAPSSLMTQVSSDDFWKGRLLPKKPRASRLAIEDGGHGQAPRSGRLNLYTTMATWCLACREEIPEFQQLRQTFDDRELAIYGLPIDRTESQELIERWADQFRPPYDLLTGLPEQEVDKASQVVLSELGIEGDAAVPAAILTDETGQVLLARWGVPSVSEVRYWLWRLEGEGRGSAN